MASSQTAVQLQLRKQKKRRLQQNVFAALLIILLLVLRREGIPMNCNTTQTITMSVALFSAIKVSRIQPNKFMNTYI